MKNIVIILCVLVGFTTNAQLNPQSKKITEKFFPNPDQVLETTPALQKKRGYTNYEELLSFLDNLADNHSDKISMSFIGKSQKGRDIPMVILTTPNDKEKIKVWMQGGLHGNEPASTESLLYLLDRLLNGESYADILENVELAVIPMANIDGYLKNNRYAANGLDLNRDQTKLMAPETVILKKAFAKFNPEVAVDFHEYRPYRRDYARMGDFGVTNMYDAMFLYSGNLNIPQNLRTLTNELFVENTRQVLDEHDYTHHPYISSRKHYGEIHINQGSISARSSATNNALTNTISTLVEIRGVALGRTSFKRRIHSSFLIAMSYLRTAAENVQLVKNEIKKATKQNNKVVVDYERGVYKDSVKFIDVSAAEYVEFEMTIRDAWKAKPKLTRSRPKAYIIDANRTDLIEKLETLGIEVQVLEEEKSFKIEKYVVDSYWRKPIRYEKMKLQTVGVNLVKEEKTFPKGTTIIMMDQRRANLASVILEPEAPNSFVSFGVLETKKGETLPIYRLIN
ncbi:M14 family metallopeptidase [Flavobacteriaceae bacterium 14752]|uniref:M14 family metallopeptidase n=1 Tax=Mesohalobacter salilacus TaxID=2491711 RepID=UPI000F634C7E|nr:peptidase [Flavobacteriaceae bacterium 14752]